MSEDQQHPVPSPEGESSSGPFGEPPQDLDSGAGAVLLGSTALTFSLVEHVRYTPRKLDQYLVGPWAIYKTGVPENHLKAWDEVHSSPAHPSAADKRSKLAVQRAVGVVRSGITGQEGEAPLIEL